MQFEFIAVTVWISVPLLALAAGVLTIAVTRRRLDAAATPRARVSPAATTRETASAATAA